MFNILDCLKKNKNTIVLIFIVYYSFYGSFVCAQAQTSSSTLVRLDKLENDVRILTGQIEQLQFENKKNADQLLKTQKDIDFRFQEISTQKEKTTLNSSSNIANNEQSASTNSLKQMIEKTYILLKENKKQDAVNMIEEAIILFPKEKSSAQVNYTLGDVYFSLERYKEAGEKFLEVYSKWPQFSRTPQAFLKLGKSLSRLNLKKEACGTFAQTIKQFGEKLPQIKEETLKETSRLKCNES